MEVANCQEKQLTSFVVSKYCELSDELLLTLDPVVLYILLGPYDGPHDVLHAEVCARDHADVLRILELGENVAAFSGFEEVDTVDLVAFEVQVLVIHQNVLLEEWTDPRNKWHRLAL